MVHVGGLLITIILSSQMGYTVSLKEPGPISLGWRGEFNGDKGAAVGRLGQDLGDGYKRGALGLAMTDPRFGVNAARADAVTRKELGGGVKGVALAADALHAGKSDGLSASVSAVVDGPVKGYKAAVGGIDRSQFRKGWFNQEARAVTDLDDEGAKKEDHSSISYTSQGLYSKLEGLQDQKVSKNGEGGGTRITYKLKGHPVGADHQALTVEGKAQGAITGESIRGGGEGAIKGYVQSGDPSKADYTGPKGGFKASLNGGIINDVGGGLKLTSDATIGILNNDDWARQLFEKSDKLRVGQ